MSAEPPIEIAVLKVHRDSGAIQCTNELPQISQWTGEEAILPLEERAHLTSFPVTMLEATRQIIRAARWNWAAILTSGFIESARSRCSGVISGYQSRSEGCRRFWGGNFFAPR